MAGSTKHEGFKQLRGDASNPTFGIAVGESSRALHIFTADDAGTDWNVAADTHPSVYIHSATTPATDYIKVYHDATIGYVDIVGGTTLRLLIAGTSEIDLTADAFSPAVTDSNALGTTALMWSDLFLASASVINFNNGDVTITHGSNLLTVGGGTVTLSDTTDASSLTAGALVVAGGVACAKQLFLGDDIDMSVSGTGVYDITLKDAVVDALSIVRGSTDVIVFNTSTPLITITPATTITGLVTASAGVVATTGGVTATAGGLIATAGGLLVTAGRIRDVMTVADLDAQSGTLTVAQIVGGILVHTSVTGGGTLTTDTAVNIVAGDSGVGALTADGQTIACYVINDGTQVVTVAGGNDVTIADTGQTIAADESAVLLFRRTAATTVTCYIIGA